MVHEVKTLRQTGRFITLVPPMEEFCPDRRYNRGALHNTSATRASTICYWQTAAQEQEKDSVDASPQPCSQHPALFAELESLWTPEDNIPQGLGLNQTQGEAHAAPQSHQSNGTNGCRDRHCWPLVGRSVRSKWPSTRIYLQMKNISIVHYWPHLNKTT